jgi:hypothetical protein
MFNQMSSPVRAKALKQMTQSGLPVMSEMFERKGDFYEQYGGLVGESGVILYYPVYSSNNNNRDGNNINTNKNATLIGSIMSEFVWSSYTQTSVYPSQRDLLMVVIENSCGQMNTYFIQGENLVLLGPGDLHDSKYSDMMHTTTYQDFETIVAISAPSQGTPLSRAASSAESGYCRYRFKVYPTQAFEEEYETNNPVLHTVIAVSVLFLVILLFVVYDCLVQQRQKQMIQTARKSTAIVSSLFPKSVRGRLLDEALQATGTTTRDSETFGFRTRKNSLQSVGSSLASPRMPLQKNDSKLSLAEMMPFGISPPIAELFSETTIMFLDLAGFIAWSSEREPTQVFTLFECIYRSFDESAKRLGVFKIETIGDSYVAAAGVPDPRHDHAVVMAKFAHDCLKRMNRLTKKLEIQLGPSTADLKARVGLHSGSVTGGVLRSEKARFQLFGDVSIMLLAVFVDCSHLFSHNIVAFFLL